MVREASEVRIEKREKMRGGNGIIEVTHFTNSPEELFGKGRMFARMTLKPGDSIGFHKHEGDGELYYILSGNAKYDDNGEIRRIQAGDVTICPEGEGHGIENDTDEPIDIIALILYK